MKYLLVAITLVCLFAFAGATKSDDSSESFSTRKSGPIVVNIKKQPLKIERKGTYYKNINHYNIKDFLNMESRIMVYTPTREHWRDLSNSLSQIPADTLRYLDSLDITSVGNDLKVKMYSSNYAYITGNEFTITDLGEKDTLTISDLKFSMHIKDNIEDAQTFRTGEFITKYGLKQDLDSVDYRITVDKDWL
ncbi:hypothetical protein [Fulvivirga ligni]|uniref:hypothetical protein n=1 Tax=Fulvivirga ligni TaxID=2904246 RepID=UPI001F199A20|nr:hypothetical protein [Fulvivirga ligni]UII19931.1 hypothetical protein LVD16_18985 [Fulvivirga ligni]